MSAPSSSALASWQEMADGRVCCPRTSSGLVQLVRSSLWIDCRAICPRVAGRRTSVLCRAATADDSFRSASGDGNTRGASLIRIAARRGSAEAARSPLGAVVSSIPVPRFPENRNKSLNDNLR